MEMKKHLIEIMRKNGITNPNDINLGFHVPPFNSVSIHQILLPVQLLSNSFPFLDQTFAHARNCSKK